MRSSVFCSATLISHLSFAQQTPNTSALEQHEGATGHIQFLSISRDWTHVLKLTLASGLKDRLGGFEKALPLP